MSQRTHAPTEAAISRWRIAGSLPPSAWALPRLLVPVALHALLFLGIFQMGYTREQVNALVGPNHRLIEPYLVAARRDGPLGVLRTYFSGESDDRLYLEYARLLWTGEVDLEHVRHVQRTAAEPEASTLPARAWPYRDVRVEYPPLTFLAIAPPALISTEYASYRRLLAGWFLLLHGLNLALALALFRADRVADEVRGPAVDFRVYEHTLWTSLVFCVLLGRLMATRMDHLVVSFVLLTLLAAARSVRASGPSRVSWAAASGVLAALGVMTKLVPGLALLAALVVWLGSRAKDRIRMALAALVAAGLVLLVSNAAMFALAGPRYLDTFRFHAQRGVQIESLYGGFLLIARGFGLPVRWVESFGSVNLESSATELIKLVSPMLFALSCVCLVVVRRWPESARSLLGLTLALLISFILTNRVLSPQYLIWIGAPLLALAVCDRTYRAPCALLLVCALVSQLIYPRGYPVLKAFHPIAIALLNLRNLGLFALLLMLVRRTPARVVQNGPT